MREQLSHPLATHEGLGADGKTASDHNTISIKHFAKRQIAPLDAHPAGEVLGARAVAVRAALDGPLLVDTHGRRFHVEGDPHAPVTPLGQLVFFSQFLATAGL